MQNLVYFYPTGHEKHFIPAHPERPERIEAVRQALEAKGWWDKFPHLQPFDLPDSVLTNVHSSEYLSGLQRACKFGEYLDMDTYTTPSSWQLALNAAGGASAVAAKIWRGEAQRGFALTRPPGHHATRNRGMGFCLLNNSAIAAQYLLSETDGTHPKAKRVAIVDLDLHHGNGTQDIFWYRNDVFYLSTHQWPLYPGSGWLDERGAGDGDGFTANFPLPIGTGDQGFQTIMRRLIMPLLNYYKPEMVLVSVGFDVHWRDPLGSLNLTANGLGSLITDLTAFADDHCGGRIVLFLEGGYDLLAAQVCSQAVVASLLNEKWENPTETPPSLETFEWQNILRSAEQVWEAVLKA